MPPKSLRQPPSTQRIFTQSGERYVNDDVRVSCVEHSHDIQVEADFLFSSLFHFVSFSSVIQRSWMVQQFSARVCSDFARTNVWCQDVAMHYLSCGRLGLVCGFGSSINSGVLFCLVVNPIYFFCGGSFRFAHLRYVYVVEDDHGCIPREFLIVRRPIESSNEMTAPRQ